MTEPVGVAREQVERLARAAFPWIDGRNNWQAVWFVEAASLDRIIAALTADPSLVPGVEQIRAEARAEALDDFADQPGIDMGMRQLLREAAEIERALAVPEEGRET